MGQKFWVICEKGWEYDDNWYYSNDDYGSGQPLTVYKKQETAEKKCREMNQERIRELFTSRTLGDYLGSDGWDNLLPASERPALFRLFNEHGVEIRGEDTAEYSLPDEGLSDEFWAAFDALGFHLVFYTVAAVSAGGTW